MNTRALAFLAAAALAAFGCAAQQPAPARPASPANKPARALGVGERAPELAIEKWIKGRPVTGFDKGKVYVVEFWATWCEPCLASIPHLTEIQKEYAARGVTVIGVASRDKLGNTLESCEKTVADKGDGIGYTIAWDSERRTNAAWMKAAGERLIPTAFIVDQSGTIAWIGPPSQMDGPLARIVAGDWDLAAAAAAVKARREAEEKALAVEDEVNRFLGLIATGEPDRAYDIARRLVDGAAHDDALLLNRIAWAIVDPAAGVEKQDLDLAMKAAARAAELTGGSDGFILDTLARVYFCRGDVRKALELQTRAVELVPAKHREQLEAVLREYKGAAK